MLSRAVYFLILVSSVSVLATPNTPIPSTSAVILPTLLKEVEAKYSKAQTLEADFQQISEVASMEQKKISSGRILIKKPGKVRWETLKPDQHLMVTDGKTFWFFTPPFDKGERGQVIERKTSEVQSRLATALLVGSFSVMTEKKWGMKIEDLTASNTQLAAKGISTFRLTPKVGVAGTVERIDVQINKEKQIEKVMLFHQGGNTAEISLTNIETGKPIKDELFVFITPPNTEKITE